MNHETHRHRQAEILTEVLKLLTQDEHVLGIVAVGSYARQATDAFSDLDIGCYLRDDERTGRQALYEQVGTVAPLLCRLWLYDVNALYLFENGVRLDLDFYARSAIQTNTWYQRANTTLLHDPDGILAASLRFQDEPEATPHPRWFQPGEPTLVDWFFWMFRQIVCWTKRSAQGGPRAFSKLSSAIESLAEIRATLMAMHLWALGIPGELGHVDAACAQRLARTYPHFTPNEVLACAQLLLDEYERVCPGYCEKAGLPYPAHKVRVMRQLVQEFEQLDG